VTTTQDQKGKGTIKRGGNPQIPLGAHEMRKRRDGKGRYTRGEGSMGPYEEE